jgi:hypothetical protein
VIFLDERRLFIGMVWLAAGVGFWVSGQIFYKLSFLFHAESAIVFIIIGVISVLGSTIYLGLGNKERKNPVEALDTMDISTIIKKEEGQHLEFKASLRYDYEKKSVNKALELEVAETLQAFMNSEGGILIIGVHDETRDILGLQKDYKTLGKKQNRDGFELQLNNVIREYLEIQHRAHIKVAFEELGNKEICKLVVSPAPTPVYNSNEKFIMRPGNSNQSLTIPQAVEYILRHWGKSQKNINETK